MSSSSSTNGPITLNVGGTKFITSVSTLTSNSAYFESLLSDNWAESNDGTEMFIDQDPVPFGILLAYMRDGMIRVDEISARVLTLAEFLGLEKLLLAVKVRWYCNIGRGPVLSKDEEIAAAFDQEHGGIRSAISAGLFPLFLKQDDVNAEKEYATVFVHYVETINNRKYVVRERGNGDKLYPDSLVGALNGIFAKGYTKHEDNLDRHNEIYDEVTFSRRKHSNPSTRSTDIFIPTDEEMKSTIRKKKFVLVSQEDPMSCDELVVPAEPEYAPDGTELSDMQVDDPYTTTEIRAGVTTELWLQQHGFVTREEELEKLFPGYFKEILEAGLHMECMIYSR